MIIAKVMFGYKKMDITPDDVAIAERVLALVDAGKFEIAG